MLCTHISLPPHTRTHTQTVAISSPSCYARVPISGCLQNISSLMIIDLLVELINNSDVIFPSDLEVIAVALQNSTRCVLRSTWSNMVSLLHVHVEISVNIAILLVLTLVVVVFIRWTLHEGCNVRLTLTSL